MTCSPLGKSLSDMGKRQVLEPECLVLTRCVNYVSLAKSLHLYKIHINNFSYYIQPFQD